MPATTSPACRRPGGSALRRARGVVLRLAFDRRAAALVGGTLTAACAGLRTFDFAWESRLSDGAGWLLGATGEALLLAAAGGRRPDWIDPADRRTGR